LVNIHGLFKGAGGNMEQNTDVSVPWEYLGTFLNQSKKKIDTALADMPESRLSYLEVKLFRKLDEDVVLEEYNLSLGEDGKGLCSDIESEGDAELPPMDDSGNVITEEQGPVDLGTSDSSQEAYLPTPAYKVVQTLLYDIRNDLDASPEVKMFAVGVRAVVSTNPDECTGYCCERRRVSIRPVRYKWFLREYYVNFLGFCRKRWTTSAC
jgi:hypothetical protein